MSLAPLPYFRNVHPDTLDKALNTLVVANNQVVGLLNSESFGAPTVAQVMQALGDPASVGYDPTYQVAGNIPPSIPYSPLYVAWNASGLMLPGGALYNFIQTQLGLTNAQMQSFM